MVIDTSIVIERVKRNEEIRENITEVTIAENLFKWEMIEM